VEAAKELAVLHEAQVNLAIKIIDNFAPKMSETERMNFVNERLTPVLNQLIHSEIQPTSINLLRE
jgi:hypothetical protein